MSFLSTVLILAFVAGVGDPPLPNPTPPKIVQGDLTLLKVASADAEDKGVVPAGSFVGRRIVFTNVSGRRLDVRVSATSCSCVSAKFSQSSVGPAESTTLTCEAPAAPVLGAQQQNVSFEVWDPATNQRQERGIILLRYTPDVMVQATPEIVNLTAVVGETASAEVIVAHSPDLAFDAKTLKPVNPWLKIQLGDTLPPTWRPDLKAERLRLSAVGDSIGVLTTFVSPNAQRSKEVQPQILVRLTVLPSIVADPPAIMLSAREKRDLRVRLLPLSEKTDMARSHAKATATWLVPQLITDHDSTSLTIRILPDAPVHAGADVEIKSDQGTVLVRIPVTRWCD